MSLLEDVFLEDEAGEAQELERVIEGDEFDDRPRYESGLDSNDNSEKEDEAEEDKRRVDPSTTKTKKVAKNPRFILNPARLTGPRGIHVIPDHFKDFKFKGKGHEKEDLDVVLKKLEHWAYRLYPKFKFDDCLKKIEMLGKKRPVMVHLQKIRSDQFMSEETVVQRDSSDDEAPPVAPVEDEFDKLLQQQIELARSTPAPNSVKKPAFTPSIDNRSPLTMPKAISSPSISDEQKERMIRNRKLAEERRISRLKNNTSSIDLTNSTMNEAPIFNENHVGKDDTNLNKNIDLTSSPSGIKIVNEVPIIVENYVPRDIDEPKVKKLNRSNIIDSSDDECEEVAVNQSVAVDVHSITQSNVEMHKQREDGKIDSNGIDNDLDMDLIESKNENTGNVPKNSLSAEDNETDITEEVNSTNKDIMDVGNENKTFEESINQMIENVNNTTGAVRTENSISKCNNEDYDIVSEGINIDTQIATPSNEQLSKVNDSNEHNISENVTNKNNDQMPGFDNLEMNIENSIDSNQLISNEKYSTQSDNVINEYNDSDHDSILHGKTKVTETSYNNLNNKEHVVSPVNNKENIDNNVEIDLMDVDFSEEF